MKITIKIFAILMLIPIAFCFSSENEYYSKNKIIEYADYLFLNNEYRAAINEYQRAYYISEKKSEKHKLKSNIGRCYYMLGEFNSAVDVYRSIINNISERQFLCETKYLIGLAYFNNGNYSLSKQYLLENTSQIQDFVLLEKNQLLLSAIYILQKKWGEALLLLGSEPLQNNPKALKLNKLVSKTRPLKEKKPILAAFFSALLPGGGKVYTKNIGDGLFSLFYTGLASFITYSEIQSDKTNSSKLLVFGALSITFYLGNVYGSYISAHLYNKKMGDELLVKVKQYLDI